MICCRALRKCPDLPAVQLARTVSVCLALIVWAEDRGCGSGLQQPDGNGATHSNAQPFLLRRCANGDFVGRDVTGVMQHRFSVQRGLVQQPSRRLCNGASRCSENHKRMYAGSGNADTRVAGGASAPRNNKATCKPTPVCPHRSSFALFGTWRCSWLRTSRGSHRSSP